MRADSIRRTNVCTERRVDSNHKEPTRSVIRADSKTSEPTRVSHTGIQRLHFQPVFKLKILKWLSFKSQRSKRPKIKFKRRRSSIGRTRERKRKREKELHFNQNLFLSKTQGEPRRTKSCYHLLNKNQKASWRNQRRSSEAKEAHIQNLLQAFQSATSDN